MFERVVTTDKPLRLANQRRLRQFAAAHPEVTVFAAHDPGGFPGPRRARARRGPDALLLVLVGLFGQ
jgi:hypothetical protein